MTLINVHSRWKGRRLRSKRMGALLLLVISLSILLCLSPSKAPDNQTRHTSLRFDWTNLPLISLAAKKLYNLQHDCSLPVKYYEWRVSRVDGSGFGMGSDLHAWGNALREGLNRQHRISTQMPWIWADQEYCGRNATLDCYFRNAQPRCEHNSSLVLHERIWVGPCGKPSHWKDNVTIPEFRAAATEFAFSSLSPVVVQEAQEQHYELFGARPTPSNLITVHVRWGDKVLEGKRRNNPIDAYVNAVGEIVQQHLLKDVHILLCTEDPVALEAFQTAARSKGWTVHIDPFYNKYLPFRENRQVIYNVPSHIAVETKGKTGLWALASLLVAMEAQHYVLTTTSNWSRLMNELRQNVVNIQCGGCTTMIDIEPGEC